jgi:predicted Zn-dependent protease
MPLTGVDRGALARALAPLAERAEDVVDAYLERLETVELPAVGEAAGVRLWREEGLAVRLCREGRTWLASRDRLDGASFADALRQVTRVAPRAVAPVVSLELPPLRALPKSQEIEAFPRLLDRALRERRVAFPYRLWLRRHRRDVLVVTPALQPPPERELFYSYEVEMPWGREGGLLTALIESEAESLAGRLADAFRGREAAPPAAGRQRILLGPAAAAILLHEAVAHALEADTLAEAGGVEKAHGLRLSQAPLDVLDDPAGAPPPVRRRTDDEGTLVQPRWLLRRGVVDQPLADRRWCSLHGMLAPGAGRRASRHRLPGPRSTYLRLLPDQGTTEELLERTGSGLFLPQATRGRLDPRSGAFTLGFAHGRRVAEGTLREPVGPCTLVGTVADLLARVEAVGGAAVGAGAGWCAKGGQRLPVWASSPEVLLADVEISA